MKLKKADYLKLHKRYFAGDLKAGYELGCYFITDKKLNKIKNGVNILKNIARRGYYEAAYTLGFYYEEETNPRMSKVMAYKWFKLSAENGIVGAFNLVAVYLEGGVYIKKDLKAAIYWYKKGASSGDPLAQYNLATNYEKGIGVKKNLELAFKWYEASFYQGMSEARYDMRRVKKILRNK